MRLRDLMKAAFGQLHGADGLGEQLVYVKLAGHAEAVIVDRLHTQRTMDGDRVVVIELGWDKRELEPAGDAGEIGDWGQPRGGRPWRI